MKKYEYPVAQRAVLEKSPIPFAIYQIIDRRLTALILSDGYCRLRGYDDRKRAFFELENDEYGLVHPDDVTRVAQMSFQIALTEGEYETVFRSRIGKKPEYHLIHAKGKHISVDGNIKAACIWYMDEGIYTDDSDLNGNVMSDARLRALQDGNIAKANEYDSLTGLPSMTYFFELAGEGIPAITRSGGEAVVLYIDLDGMKYYNTKYGFDEGDKLLQAFSRLLAVTFRTRNCCHVGGDHFAVYTRDIGLEDVLNCLFEEWQNQNGANTLPVHVGIYPTGKENVTASIAFDRAMLACDAVSNVYGSCFNYYKKELREVTERRHYILDNLDQAIEKGWIQVYYQPIVRAVTNRVSDEEALARWIDPVMGFLSPGDFIPWLEDAGLIYKLDLHILDLVLEKVKKMAAEGFYIVPQSINLSRSDFDACDIVEEVRKRVDASGIGRDKITIEITESIIGRDFDFIKSQIGRFRDLGFAVWMDDFGSGYSSLDVLQSVEFELVKFDMSFMSRLDEGENGKILLSELMRLARSLGMDVLCEGVETENHVSFLKDIGCSKLQGYYFSKPISLDNVLDRYRKGIQIGFENPDEAEYYESVGRIDLFDLTGIANGEDSVLNNTFNTVPVGIIELWNKRVNFLRTNPSFQKFIKRFFKLDTSDNEGISISRFAGMGQDFLSAIRRCRKSGENIFVDDTMKDGAVVHSFVRRLATNPVKNTVAIAIAILSVAES